MAGEAPKEWLWERSARGEIVHAVQPRAPRHVSSYTACGEVLFYGSHASVGRVCQTCVARLKLGEELNAQYNAFEPTVRAWAARVVPKVTVMIDHREYGWTNAWISIPGASDICITWCFGARRSLERELEHAEKAVRDKVKHALETLRLLAGPVADFEIALSPLTYRKE